MNRKSAEGGSGLCPRNPLPRNALTRPAHSDAIACRRRGPLVKAYSAWNEKSGEKGTALKRNRLGKTELEVSVLGLGGHEYRWLHAGNIRNSRHTRFNPERLELVNRARERGINYFDTTFQEEAQSLGRILKQTGGRDEIIVNGMIISVLKRTDRMTDAQADSFIREELETRLEFLGSPFDIFMLCAIDHGYDPSTARRVVDIYERHREAGAFKFLGVSCHSYRVLVDFLRLDIPVDVVMFPFNYGRNHLHGSDLKEIFRLIDERDLGAVAIKPLCWTRYGIPFTCINPEGHDIQTLIRHSLAWQTAQKSIHTSVVGVETIAELDNNIDGVGLPHDEKLLLPCIESKGSLELLVRGGLRHSEEIQERIVKLVRQKSGRDLGDNLEDYVGKME